MTAGSGAKILLAYSDPATQQAVLPTAKFTERTLAEVRRRDGRRAPPNASRESRVCQRRYAIAVAR